MFTVIQNYWRTLDLLHMALIFLPGCESILVRGVVHQDVLLPCMITYKDIFSHEDLVISWQRSENDTVVHSYFNGRDQPQYQDKEFKGKTQLFPQEFPKGNVSLLVKAIKTSDAGNYTCYAVLNEKTGYLRESVELLVEYEAIVAEDKKGGKLYLIFLVVVILIPAGIIIMFLMKYQKKHKRNDEEQTVRLIDDSLNEAIGRYKETIQKTALSCCKFLHFEEKETNSCLTRMLHVVNQKLSTGAVPAKLSNDMFIEKSEGSIRSDELFTQPQKNWASQRILIAGEAGIGKSCLSKRFQIKWASESNIFYNCIIYFTFGELNSIDKPVSVIQLLKSKCTELSLHVSDLLRSPNVLIILDGLDEFNHSLTDQDPDCSYSNDTPLEIGILVSKIITKKLIPTTDVLVTSQLTAVSNIQDKFDSVFLLCEFTDNQIKEYYNNDAICDFIYKFKLSSLVRIPFQSGILRELYKIQDIKSCKNKLNTCSQMMICLLQCCQNNFLSEKEEADTALNKELTFREKKSAVIYQLTKLSYENLVHGVQEIKKEDLQADYSDIELFFTHFSVFFLKKSDGKSFEYKHISIRDLFAALYCVQEIQNEEELIECLNAWVFGEMSPNPKKIYILQHVTLDNKIIFQNFIKFFMGLLTCREVTALLSAPHQVRNLTTDSLQKWFEEWSEKRLDRTNSLNFLHYIYELHDSSVTHAVSQCFKEVTLFNQPLSSLDIRAMEYCLERSNLEKIDLRLCQLGDGSLENLCNILKNCKSVALSSNKLTEKSGKFLQNILEDPDCAIEDLWLGTNKLGSQGAEQIWKALEINRSLQYLSLNDNDLSAKCTGSMVHSLKKNKTLKELQLCMNTFLETGEKNIKELKNSRRDLKVVVKIAEDEDVFCYVENKVQTLFSEGWKTYNQDWLLRLLQYVLTDLSYGEISVPEANVNELQQKVKQLINQIKMEDRKGVALA